MKNAFLFLVLVFGVVACVEDDAAPQMPDGWGITSLGLIMPPGYCEGSDGIPYYCGEDGGGPPGPGGCSAGESAAERYSKLGAKPGEVGAMSGCGGGGGVQCQTYAEQCSVGSCESTLTRCGGTTWDPDFITIRTGYQLTPCSQLTTCSDGSSHTTYWTRREWQPGVCPVWESPCG